MNIITKKEVFSEENQAKTPKKIEKRRGRPRTGPRPTESNPQPSPEQKGDDNQSKTVFYQAARPRNNRPNFRPAGTSTPNTPAINPNSPIPTALPGQAIDPRSLIRSRPPMAPQNHPVQTQTNRPPQSNNRPSNDGGRFTTARRRPDRGRMPSDGAGTFMPSASARLAAPPVEQAPRTVNTSNMNVKIIPLGGLEEIGKNMTVFEYGNDIMIVDMGLMFPESDMFGVDYVIPDVSYLEDKKDKIRGAIITHGHLDHTGAIPYLVEKLGFPTMYGTPITMGMVKHRLEEFGLEGKNKLITIEPEKDVIQLGVFRVTPYRLTHSIPGAVGLEIETPNGRISYATDWKFDYTPADGDAVDYRNLAAVGSRGVDLLFSDSTNAEKPGHSISEKVVEASLNQAVEEAEGRVIIAMFSTNLSRIQQTLNIAAKNNRKVLIVGRSMQQNVEMAVNLKAMNVPQHTLISEREVNRFNDNQILILSTGAQGEDRSALTRMANGDHRVIKIKRGDTVIISASPIPGNERSVSGLMDVLYKAGASVIYNKTLDVHTSGHAYAEDLKLMIALMRPKFFMPLHGERSKLILHGKLAQEVGVKPENVLIGDNGLILEMSPDGRVFPTDNHVPAGYVMVDGLGVGDVGNIVLRDRQAMAQEGIFIIFSVYDGKNKRWMNSPDIISRGFIYMRENEQFVNDIRNEIKKFLGKAIEQKSVDIGAVRNELRDFISKLLYEKTERQPLVIPVITEV